MNRSEAAKLGRQAKMERKRKAQEAREKAAETMRAKKYASGDAGPSTSTATSPAPEAEDRVKIVDAPLRNQSRGSLELTCIVIPPLHTLQGLVNTALLALHKTDAASLKQLLQEAGVAQSHQTSSMLNGRSCRRWLQYVHQRPEIPLLYAHQKTNVIHDIRPVFTYIYNLQRWALASSMDGGIEKINDDIIAQLPIINKLHLVESHLADYFDANGSWGMFGEQGLESMHHIGNLAAERCFGINAVDRLPYFMRQRLLACFLNASEFAPRSRHSSDDTAEMDVVFDDEIQVAATEEVIWRDVEWCDDD